MDIGNKGLMVRIADWDQYFWLRHGFSTREGGVSKVYGGDSLNLGWTGEDDPALVAENRRRFLSACCDGSSESDQAGQQTVTLKQVHSEVVWPIRESDGVREGKLQTADGKAVLEGDGLMTELPGVMLGVQTADCVPVLVADVKKRAVAAFHAGWRGTVVRIVEHGVEKMRLEYGSNLEDLIAAVGPSIGPCCYAVGEEVHSRFGSQFGYAHKLFRTMDGAQTHLDLWQANRRQLMAAGLKESRIAVVRECTACARNEQGERKYFSHRAEHGHAGRMMSVIGVANVS